MKVTVPSVPLTDVGARTLPAVGEGVPLPKPAKPTSTNAPQGVAQAFSSEATPQKLHQAVEELQRKVQLSAPNLKFSIDHGTGRTVIKVTDANTKEVIRQIPAEEILLLAKEIDRMQGLLLHKQG